MSTIDYNLFAFLLGKFVEEKGELIVKNKKEIRAGETSMFNMKNFS